MKRIIVSFLIIVLTLPLLAQNDTTKKRGWFDLQLAQHIGLGRWSMAGYVNKGLPRTGLTELRGTFNHYLFGWYVGCFADMSIGIMPASEMKSFNLGGMPMPHSGTQYYLREMLSESGNGSTSAHFKMTFGLFGSIPSYGKLTIKPYLGGGFITMSQRKYEMILKEHGSNMQYQTVYIWNSAEDNEHQSASVLGYFTARLNFKYKLSHRTQLLLGLEYTWFQNTLDFYGRYTNTFNANIERSFSIKGNKMNMLGVAVGISFM
jgi:hypothetical protein